MPLAGFYTGYRTTVRAPSELITAIEIPAPGAGEVLKVRKVAKRYDQDISSVCVALRATVGKGVLRGVRVAFGGMAATPARALAVEQLLEGLPPDTGLRARLAEALAPGGTALVVANRTLPYEADLDALGSLRTLREERGYKLLSLRRSSRSGSSKRRYRPGSRSSGRV